MMRAWMVWLAIAGCMTPVMRFGGGKTAKEAQHDTMNDLRPTQLSLEGKWRGPLRDATVRVYADDQYRAQNVTWRQAFGETLDYANAVLGPKLGLRLVADYREWNRHVPGSTLQQDIEELQRLDGGRGALSVIGLTSSLGLVSATFDQLGIASLGGRYMMLRGYADVEERKAFAAAFPDLAAKERENTLVARRIHKNTAVFLHELAHNLGVSHEWKEDTLMNASYSTRAADFSADAHETMQYRLEKRLAGQEADVMPGTNAAAVDQAATPRPTLVVRVTAKDLIVDGKSLDLDEVNVYFSVQAGLDKDTEIVIQADKGVPTGRVIEVMDKAKAQGFTRITRKL